MAQNKQAVRELKWRLEVQEMRKRIFAHKVRIRPRIDVDKNTLDNSDDIC